MTVRIGRRELLQSLVVAAAAGSAGTRALAAGASPDVIVIGTGLSGLNAALMLEEAGASVTCLEGRNRVGGRLFSHTAVTGNPEWGGDSILGGYGRMQDTARRLGVKLDRSPGPARFIARSPQRPETSRTRPGWQRHPPGRLAESSAQHHARGRPRPIPRPGFLPGPDGTEQPAEIVCRLG